MRSRGIAVLFVVVAWIGFAGPARADKTLDLGKTKFKEIAKYLNLTAEQEAKIKPDVERIQDVVKQAAKQGGSPGFGAGGRTPIGGGGRWGGSMGGNQGAVQVGDRAERQAQRVEWQKEITNRVEEIQSFLTPEQREKFKTITIPDILAPMTGGK